MALVELAALPGHAERVWHVEFSPDGRQLASCSADRTVRLWALREGAGTLDAAAWRCVAVLEDAHQRTVRSVAWSSDGTRLAAASFDATVSVWGRRRSAADGAGAGAGWECVATLEGHENEVKSVAWHRARPLLASASRDKSVWVWAAEPGDEFECVSVCSGHAQDVKAVAWHPAQDLLASASYDDTVKLWQEDEDDWYCSDTLSGHLSTVWDVRFDPAGQQLVSCSDDLSLRVWQPAGGKWRQAAVIQGAHTRTIFSADWSYHTPALLASAGGDDALVVHGPGPQAQPAEPTFVRLAARAKAHASDVNCVRWSPRDRDLLATCGDDALIRLWRLQL